MGEYMGVSGIAEGLQSIKLKSLGADCSSNVKGNDRIEKGAGMASMLDEMQKTLAKRRLRAEASAETDSEGGKKTNDVPSKVASPILLKTSTPIKPKPLGTSKLNTSVSLGKLEVVSGSRGLELVNNKEMNKLGCTAVELESAKQGILQEMRDEIVKAKTEIIELIKQELSRVNLNQRLENKK